jgi:hypothetical protein
MKVNCCRCRHHQGAKDAERLWPKGQCSRLFLHRRGTHGQERLPAYKAGTSSFVLEKWNMISPPSRHFPVAGVTARCADGVWGKGYRKKRMPSCNGADRSCDITPPCKWADFRLVMGDEIACRTFLRRKCK